jgi:hypothetical protein
MLVDFSVMIDIMSLVERGENELQRHIRIPAEPPACRVSETAAN